MIRRNASIALCAALVLSLSAGAFAQGGRSAPDAAMQQRYDALLARMNRMEARLKELEAASAQIADENKKLKAENQKLKAEVVTLKKTKTPTTETVKSTAEPITSPTPLLTDAEYQQVLALIAAREAMLLDKNLITTTDHPRDKKYRDPISLLREYERYKYDEAKRRWKEKPAIPTGPWHHWRIEEGTSYQNQLFCDKCKGQKLPDGHVCNGWVNASGTACQMLHPLSEHDSWMFFVNYLKGRDKAVEAKMWLWYAFDKGDITEEMWEQLMAASF